MIVGWGIFFEIALIWMSLDFDVDPDVCRHVVSLGHNELIN